MRTWLSLREIAAPTEMEGQSTIAGQLTFRRAVSKRLVRLCKRPCAPTGDGVTQMLLCSLTMDG